MLHYFVRVCTQYVVHIYFQYNVQFNNLEKVYIFSDVKFWY